MSEARIFIEEQIKLINDEVSELNKQKKLYRDYAYRSSINGNIKKIDFQHLISECERIAVYVDFLENLKNDYHKALNAF